MAYISSFAYCDSVNQQITPEGPKIQLNNPLQVLAPIAIPGNYSFSVVCDIAGFASDSDNFFQFQFVSPNGQIIFDTGKMPLKPDSKQVQSENHTNIQIVLDLRNLVFMEKGLYVTKAYFNNDQIGEYKIEVIKGEFNG